MTYDFNANRNYLKKDLELKQRHVNLLEIKNAKLTQTK